MSTDPELQTLFFLTLLLTPVMPRAHCPYLFQPSILHSCSIFPRLMPTTAQAGREGVFLVSPLPLQQSATIHGSSGAVPFWKAIHRQTPARTGCAPDSCLQQNPVSGLGPSCPLPSPRLLREPSQRAFSTSAVQWQFLQTRVSLIQELKEQTSERQFGWITGEQYPEIYISDST